MADANSEADIINNTDAAAVTANDNNGAATEEINAISTPVTPAVSNPDSTNTTLTALLQLLQSVTQQASNTNATTSTTGTAMASTSSGTITNNTNNGQDEDVGDEENFILDEEEEEDETVTDAVSESIKKLLETRSTQLCEDIYQAKSKKIKRPSNLNIHSPRVNPEIWTSLPMHAKQRDKG